MARGSAIGSLFVSLGMDTGAFENSAQAAAREAARFGQRLSRVGDDASRFADRLNGTVGVWTKFGAVAVSARTAIAGVGAAMAAIGAAQAARGTVRWVQSMAEAGESAVNLSAALGIPLDKLVELQGVAQLTEGSVEGASRAILRLSGAVSDAIAKAGPAREQFAAIGITLDDLKAKGNDPIEMLRLLADRWVAYQDGAQKSAVFTDLLGRSMQELLPWLSGGSERIDALIKRHRELDPAALDAAKAGDALATKLDTLSTAAKGLADDALAGLRPDLEAIITALTSLVSAGRVALSWINDTVPSVSTLAGKFGELATNIGNAARARLQWMGLDGLKGGTTEDILAERERQDRRLRADRESETLSASFGREPPPKPRDRGIFTPDIVGDKNDMARRRDAPDDRPVVKPPGTGGAGGGGRGGDGLERAARDIDRFFDEQQRRELAAITGQEALANASFTLQQQRIRQLAQLGQITSQKAVDDERQLLDRRWALDLEYYRKKLEATAGDADEQARVNADILVDYERFLTEREALDHNANMTRFRDLKQAIDDVAGVMKNSFSDAFDKITEGTFKLRDAIGALLKDIGRMLANRAFDQLLGGGSNGGGWLDKLLGGLLGFGGSGISARDAGPGIASIDSFFGFAAGGPVRGPGSATGDSIVARLSDGEFVVNARSARQYAGLLAAINDAPRFAGGGPVGNTAAIDRQLVGFRDGPGEMVNIARGDRPVGGAELVRIELNPSEGWVAGVADQRILSRSGQIIEVAVVQSQRATRRNFAGLAREAQARSM